mmetsp:Transcript_122885/g.342442  ORF Transcript_122885/g.342442 Transcript_122885/m.342442 type:complete len:217 (+) Transcript_122885:82-732(+)
MPDLAPAELINPAGCGSSAFKPSKLERGCLLPMADAGEVASAIPPPLPPTVASTLPSSRQGHGTAWLIHSNRSHRYAAGEGLDANRHFPRLALCGCDRRLWRSWRFLRRERLAAHHHGHSIVARHGRGIFKVLDLDIIRRLDLQTMWRERHHQPRGVWHPEELGLVDSSPDKKRGTRLVQPSGIERVGALRRDDMLGGVRGAGCSSVAAQVNQDLR